MAIRTKAEERLDELDAEYGSNNLQVTEGPDSTYVETDTGVMFKIDSFSGQMWEAPIDWTEAV